MHYQYMIQKNLRTQAEIFDGSFRQLEVDLNNLLNRVTPSGLSYGQRGWIREALEAGSDILRQKNPDTSALDQLLNNPPARMPPDIVNQVRELVGAAIGLPETAQQREAVRLALEQAANSIVSGPSSQQARSFQRSWQQAVPRRTQP